jgi:hypothetical protein
MGEFAPREAAVRVDDGQEKVVLRTSRRPTLLPCSTIITDVILY